MNENEKAEAVKVFTKYDQTVTEFRSWGFRDVVVENLTENTNLAETMDYVVPVLFRVYKIINGLEGVQFFYYRMVP